MNLNFYSVCGEDDQQLRELDQFLRRIEAHVRKKNFRAARAEYTFFLHEVERFAEKLEAPYAYMLIGAQMGLLSGRNSILQSYLPCSLLGSVCGWMIGHMTMTWQRQALHAMLDRMAQLQEEIWQDENTSNHTLHANT